MKKSIQVVLLVICVTLVSVFHATAQILSDLRRENRIEVIFNNKLDAKEVENIRNDLFQYGIILKYDYLDFDNKGKLVSIRFNVDCKDGFSGSTERTGLTKDSRFGFFRDYAADATVSKPPFGTGDIE